MSEPDDASPAEIAKSLRLRGDPPPAMRLSRRTIAVLSGGAAVAVAAALFFALRPATHRTPSDDQTVNTESHTPSEVITGAPKDYDKAPRLGPPLPGDLGRPILGAQARGVDVPPPPIGAPAQGQATSSVRNAPSPSPAERDRLSARTSTLLVRLGARAEPSTPQLAMPSPIGPVPTPSVATSGPATGSQAAERAFLAAGATTSTARPQPPVSPFILQAGSVIPAALITGIRSDLPGQVTAQVTQDVYDSPTGKRLLIPQGSRLVGVYDSEIGYGQSRVLLVWTRLILPGGRSLDLGREPGVDPQGFAGLEDRVDRRWGQVARAAVLSSLLGVGAELSAGDDDGDVARALRRSVQDTADQTGRQLVGRSLDIQPTLTIRPGHPVSVMVTHDLIFEP